MTEDNARAWIGDRFGARVVDRLASFATLVEQETERQNLISASSLPSIWSRHIMDSAQLVPLVGPNFKTWLDIGTGAGFPGLVVGAITEEETILVEPRKRRVEFLQSVIDTLGLRNTTVRQAKVETVSATADVISARAVAQVEAIFASAHHIANKATTWILPKGKSAHEEVALAKRAWHGTFHVEHSLTDPMSLIVIASRIARR
jgi:16S rRNA (guanine527-N7)-methyltransferase